MLKLETHAEMASLAHFQIQQQIYGQIMCNLCLKQEVFYQVLAH